MRIGHLVLAGLPLLAMMGLWSGTVQAEATLDAVRQRGQVICGVNVSTPGFSMPDQKGEWHGLDIDLCRGIAAAVFGDPAKARFVPTTNTQRFPALQSGEIDVLTRNVTQTLARDTALGFNMAGVNFYDAQGFMVRRDLGVKSAKELNGATVCVQPGTTTELNMADYARVNGIAFKSVVIESQAEMFTAFSSGRCDALTTDSSQLASLRATMSSTPDSLVILPERISKEPLGPMVRHGDDQWFDIVKWTLTAMIEAEELGISQANVDAKLKSDEPAVKRFLGVTPGLGAGLSVDEKWAYAIVKAVGNYGDSYDRNFGVNSPIKLERGLNSLWTKGGLMYAIPVR